MPPVVVLDACVLYPAAQRDFLMWLAAGGAIRAHWTQEIHEEWMRNVERDYGIARSVLERVRTLMDQAAGDALISHYRQHAHLFTKTDAKDRHVAAAAVAARKRSKVPIVTIITWNLGDFDRNELAKVGVAAKSLDAFLAPCSRNHRKKRLPRLPECGTSFAIRQRQHGSASIRLPHKV